jgi:hypothetical protein
MCNVKSKVEFLPQINSSRLFVSSYQSHTLK